MIRHFIDWAMRAAWLRCLKQKNTKLKAVHLAILSRVLKQTLGSPPVYTVSCPEAVTWERQKWILYVVTVFSRFVRASYFICLAATDM